MIPNTWKNQLNVFLLIFSENIFCWKNLDHLNCWRDIFHTLKYYENISEKIHAKQRRSLSLLFETFSRNMKISKSNKKT